MPDATQNTGGSPASRFASRRFVLTNRRLCLAVASRFANRRLVFSIAAVSILSAKCIHVYAHIAALPPAQVCRWGLSFFAQDTALLLMLRLLLDAESPVFAAVSCLRFVATALACLITLVQHSLAAINISFFVVAGSELHWRNVGLAGDSSSWSVLLAGLVSCSIAFATVLVVGWLLQDLCYLLAGMAIDIVKLPFTFLFSKISCRGLNAPNRIRYNHVPQKELDLEDGSEDDDYHMENKHRLLAPASDAVHESKTTWLLYTVVGILLVAQAVLTTVRPAEGSLVFMSWTPILLPFIDFAHSSPTLASLMPYYGHGIGWGWDNQTALAEPIRWDWLPRLDEPLPGFEDWYQPGMQHYNAANDPLKVSNLDDDLLSPLRGKLAGVDIRHVVLIKLESTRKDVFPLKKDGQIWNKLAETWENGVLPESARRRLSSLTPTANFLTGDFDDGFSHNHTRRRGGVNVNNDHTTGTYTLKSLPGTLCGITPLVADFNLEYDHHVYQPCLPHIFNAFNALDHSNDSDSTTDDYTGYKWSNSFMMSVTNFYDKQDLLMPVLGYKNEELITKEYLQSDDAKFGKATLPNINYYGMRESAVEDYIKDAFETAKENKERVFLTHLTSTAHHPFSMPDEETYVPLADGDKLEDLSHYVNTVGFVDRWLGRILEILEEQGVGNETLVVLVGDHGLSVPETGAVTPYYQPNVGNFHVPLVLSHPALPAVDVDSPVNSISVLPTILDLLIETGSLSRSERAAARDLVRNYEGQSLIRPLQRESRHTGQADWQFTVMNTGRAQVATRSARNPQWRVVVPVVKDIEWRFTNVETDPHEKDAVLSFDFENFVRSVEKKYGGAAANWAEEAAFVTRWWVDENARRWRFSP
ncbi:uncharacterized protein UV8b_07784 [Ustilaginoidea virens]|uniref:Sulfatase N-terminal domain-containing protein n=1 Tax=Ustilaginoidea virens TaxID=1159556 RepID=A0A8E5HYB5_USTVR|nr:uncharacterized protein UV8b_07784 [Ustilaginoidea virens]QUC23543.1 hypothetical protein UV8b_07784 [Ustilaginoidea virens]